MVLFDTKSTVARNATEGSSSYAQKLEKMAQSQSPHNTETHVDCPCFALTECDNESPKDVEKTALCGQQQPAPVSGVGSHFLYTHFSEALEDKLFIEDGQEPACFRAIRFAEEREVDCRK